MSELELAVHRFPYKTKYVRAIKTCGQLWVSAADCLRVIGREKASTWAAINKLPWVETSGVGGGPWVDAGRIGELDLALRPAEELRLRQLAAWCRESLPGRIQEIEEARARVRPMADDYRQAREPSFLPAASMH